MKSVRFLALAAGAALLTSANALRADDSSPATQIKSALGALANNDVKTIIETMPKSYRQDAEDIFKEAVKQIDEEVWNKGFAAAKKMVKVLKNKKAMALEAIANFPLPFQPDDTGKIYDGIIGFLEAPIDSPMADHSSAKALKLEDWAADVGGKALKAVTSIDVKLPPKNQTIGEQMKSLANAKVDVISSDANSATVKIAMAGQDAPPQEVKLKKVDGVWVSADLAEKWSEGVAKAKAEMAKEKFSAEDKKKSLKAIATFEEALGIVDGAKNGQEFMAALTEAGEKLKALRGGDG